MTLYRPTVMEVIRTVSSDSKVVHLSVSKVNT